VTTTSDEIELRDPYANAYNPAAERQVTSTFGAPRRRRERNKLLATIALIGVPLLAMGGIGAATINSYHHALEERASQDAPATQPSAANVTPTGADAELMSHAPTGSDVGTEGLSPALTRAITRAREAAAADAVTINIVSGYRTAATQQRLFNEAITKYGSAEVASRWVLPPDKSEHVKGGAVDVGPYAAAKWLEKNGVKFGLCRRYANEYWHFEVLAPAKGQKCPALEANAAGQ